jgi:hypothetical protein
MTPLKNTDTVEPSTETNHTEQLPVDPAIQGSRWLPLIGWYRQHVGLEFDSVEDYDAALDLVWSDPELLGVPRVHVGRNTMIVPAAAAPIFQKKGCKFTPRKVISAGDLPAEEVNRIRRGERRS